MDENLKQFCTPRQLEYLQAVEQYGSNNKASKMIGVDRRTLDRALHSVQIKAARSGYSPKQHLKALTSKVFLLFMTKMAYQRLNGSKPQQIKNSKH